MKIYVVTYEPYHDNSAVMGAYSSVENAMNAFPCVWSADGHYVTHRGAVRQGVDPDSTSEDFLIWGLEVDPCE